MKSKITRIQSFFKKGIVMIMASVYLLTPIASAAETMLDDNYLKSSFFERLWYGSVGSTVKEIEEYLENHTTLYIQNETQLRALAEYVNNGNDCYGKEILLLNNIYVDNATKWIPIGKNLANSFRGNFNGNGYTIEGIKITEIDDETEGVGLFGVVGEFSTISNLTTTNFDIFLNDVDNVGNIAGISYGTITNCINKSDICGASYVGGIVGSTCKGTISNCYNLGDVEGKNTIGGIAGWIENTNIKYCTNEGKIAAETIAGGIGGNGRAKLTIEYSKNTGSITTEFDTAGGIIALVYENNGDPENNGDIVIKYCHNIGEVYADDSAAGGIVGSNNMEDDTFSMTILRCVNSGNIISKYRVGGFIGWLSSYNCKIEYCINQANIVGTEYVGGIVGEWRNNKNSDGILNCRNSGNIIGNANIGGMVGIIDNFASFDEGWYKISNCINEGDIGTDTSKYVGGTIGNIESKENRKVEIKNIKNRGDIYGTNYLGGVIGFAGNSLQHGAPLPPEKYLKLDKVLLEGGTIYLNVDEKSFYSHTINEKLIYFGKYIGKVINYDNTIVYAQYDGESIKFNYDEKYLKNIGGSLNISVNDCYVPWFTAGFDFYESTHMGYKSSLVKHEAQPNTGLLFPGHSKPYGNGSVSENIIVGAVYIDKYDAEKGTWEEISDKVFKGHKVFFKNGDKINVDLCLNTHLFVKQKDNSYIELVEMVKGLNDPEKINILKNHAPAIWINEWLRVVPYDIEVKEDGSKNKYTEIKYMYEFGSYVAGEKVYVYNTSDYPEFAVSYDANGDETRKWYKDISLDIYPNKSYINYDKEDNVIYFSDQETLINADESAIWNTPKWSVVKNLPIYIDGVVPSVEMNVYPEVTSDTGRYTAGQEIFIEVKTNKRIDALKSFMPELKAHFGESGEGKGSIKLVDAIIGIDGSTTWTYSYTIQNSDEGALEVEYVSGEIVDGIGHKLDLTSLELMNFEEIFADNIAPKVNITTPDIAGNITGAQTIKYRLEFTEKVEGFRLDDINVIGGNNIKLTKNQDNRIFEIEVTSNVLEGNVGVVKLIIEANSCNDLTGIGNLRSEHEVNVDKKAPVLNKFNVLADQNVIINEEINAISENCNVGDKITIEAIFDENIEETEEFPELILQFSESGLSAGTIDNVEIESNKITYSYEITEGDRGKLYITAFKGEVYDIVGNQTTINENSIKDYNINADSDAPTLVGITAIAPEFEYNSLLTEDTIRYGVKNKENNKNIISIIAEYSEDVYKLNSGRIGKITAATAPELKIKIGKGTEKIVTFEKAEGNKIYYTYDIKSGDSGELSIISLTGIISDITGNTYTRTETTTLPKLFTYRNSIQEENKLDNIVVDANNLVFSIEAYDADGKIVTDKYYKAGKEVTIVVKSNEYIYKNIENVLERFTTDTMPVLKVNFAQGKEESQATAKNVEYKDNVTTFTYTYIVKDGDNGVMSCKFELPQGSDIALNTKVESNFVVENMIADTRYPVTNVPSWLDSVGYGVKDNNDGTWEVTFSEVLYKYNIDLDIVEDALSLSNKSYAPILLITDGRETFETKITSIEVSEENKTIITYKYDNYTTNLGALGLTNATISDRAGNLLNYKDQTAPIGTIEYIDNGNNTVTAVITFNEDVIITNNSGNNTYVFTENKEFTFEFEDLAGNKATATAKVESIDMITPEGYVNIIDNGDNTYTAKIIFSEEVTITNNDGLDTYLFTENGEFTFEFEDAAGHRNTAKAEVYEIVPEIDVYHSDLEYWTNENIYVEVYTDDELVSLDVIQKVVDGENVINILDNKTYTITANGTYEIIAKDKYGNETKEVIEVKNIDKTSPTSNANAVEVNGKEITITATDNQSGIGGYAVSKSTAVPGEWSASNIIKVAEDGAYYVWVIDNVGNMAITDKTIIVDTTAPTIMFNYTSLAVTEGEILEATITTNEESKLEYYWSWVEEGIVNESKVINTNNYATNFKLSKENVKAGRYVLNVKAIDVFGNESTIQELEFVVTEKIVVPEIIFKDLKTMQVNGVKYVKVSQGMTMEELIAKMDTEALCGQVPGFNNLANGVTIKTGTEISLNWETKYVIVVNGDVNGDGKVDFMGDVISANNYRIGQNKLADMQKLAADINSNGTIDFIQDIIAINNYRLGISNSL